MKKILGVLFLSVILARSAFAVTTIPWTKEGCESVKGQWITAHSATDSGCDANHCNGLTFCEQPLRVNWWSALLWCQSIGHKLVDIETACPKGLSVGACANLNGRVIDLGWTSTPVSGTASRSYFIRSNGNIQGDGYTERKEVGARALCME